MTPTPPGRPIAKISIISFAKVARKKVMPIFTKTE